MQIRLRNSSQSVALLLVLLFVVSGSACIQQDIEQLKETKSRVKNKLNEIKNYGSIEHSTRQMLEATYAGYAKFIDARGTAPTRWSDLMSAPGLSVDQLTELRNAKNKIKDIVWNAKLENLDDPELANAKLASFENQLTGQVIVLQANGSLSQVSASELSEIPLAK